MKLLYRVLSRVIPVSLVAAFSCLQLRAEEPTSLNHHAVFMRAKLASCQKVMEGLVTEDFRLIARCASEMEQMSEAALWPTTTDKSYLHYQEAFRRQCERLAELAESRNLSGVHYTYLNLATTCVNCHDYVRHSFRVQEDNSNPRGPVMLIPNEWEESGRVPAKETSYSGSATRP